jgi:UDP-GlcNAc:undecaprenyl-phosphate GlcNAc-1-phosphate transferase
MALAVAAGCVFILTPFSRFLAERFEALDRPDRDRKKHRRLVPLWGGLAIFPGLVAGVAAAFFWTPQGREILQYQQGTFASRIFWILPAWVLLWAVGLADDKIRIPPKIKLLVHLLASACAVWAAGFRWESLAGLGETPWVIWPWLGSVLSVLWLTFMTNAFNFIDGLDGLAVGQAAITGAATALAAVLLAAHHSDLASTIHTLGAAPLAGAAAGAALGFWRYNRAPAKIFLGDAGSTLLGFTLALALLAAAGRTPTPWALGVPVCLLAWPLADASLAVVRRWRRHEPISKADHRHLHHRLLDHGFSPGAAVALIRAVALAGALAALVLAWL